MNFITIKKFLCSTLFIICAGFFAVYAQSTDQNFPTAITSNQIEGTINARDIGDSRLTNYFYTFNGTQGDVFVNVVTKNFNGAVDIFNVENLQPITKIVFYASDSSDETGRVFYLRKPEKMILRVQGRTPNDDPATFQIKFAGSFAPAIAIAESERPETPKVTKENDGDIIVNSVGTIIGVKPKPTPSPVAKKEEKVKPEKIIVAETKPEETIKEVETEMIEKPIQVIVTDPIAGKEEIETVSEKTEEENKPETPIEKPVAEVPETEVVTEETKKEETADAKKEDEKEDKAKALANIRLTIVLKNGDKFVRPMSEVFSVNIDDGKMTVITKDGDIKRFSILDIAKTTIE